MQLHRVSLYQNTEDLKQGKIIYNSDGGSGQIRLEGTFDPKEDWFLFILPGGNVFTGKMDFDSDLKQPPFIRQLPNGHEFEFSEIAALYRISKL